MKTRLIQVTWGSLTLISLWVFGFGLYLVFSYFQTLPAKQAQALAVSGISPSLFLAMNVLFVCIIYFSFFIVAQLIMLRRAQERFSILAAIVLLAFGTSNAALPLPETLSFYYNQDASFLIPFNILNFLGWTLICAFLVTYPDGKFTPRWTIALALLGFVVSALWTTNPDTFSSISGVWAILLLVITVGGYGGILYAQFWRYRHLYSPAQKQQVKWFGVGVFGILLTVLPTVILYPRILDPATLAPELLQAEFIFLVVGLSIIILPISVGIAILRYRLWDIDVIVRKTVTYAIVAALLAVVYFGSIVLLQRIFASVTGSNDQVITVVSTLAIAALFVPLRNRIQAFIDRRFYRKKYDAQQVLADFANTVRDETDLEKLTDRLVQVVNETMQPKNVSVWLKRED